MKRKELMKKCKKVFSAVLAAAMITTSIAPESLVLAAEVEETQGFGDSESMESQPRQDDASDDSAEEQQDAPGIQDENSDDSENEANGFIDGADAFSNENNEVAVMAAQIGLVGNTFYVDTESRDITIAKIVDFTNNHDGTLTAGTVPTISPSTCTYSGNDYLVQFKQSSSSLEAYSKNYDNIETFKKNSDYTGLYMSNPITLKTNDKVKIGNVSMGVGITSWTYVKDGYNYFFTAVQDVINPVKVNYNLQFGTGGPSTDWVWTVDNEWKSDHNTIPTRKNYIFDGWYTGTNGSGIKVETVAQAVNNASVGDNQYKEITLYAKWIPHTHSWHYGNKGSDMTIVEACCTEESNKCDYYGEDNALQLTLMATEDEPRYDGNTHGAAITENNITSVTNAAASEPRYYLLQEDGTEIETTMDNSGASTQGGAPVNAGSYVAKVSIGTATAEAYYTIEKADISPSVEITDWGYGSYNQSVNGPELDGNPGGGSVTYTYKKKNADDSTYIEVTADTFPNLPAGEYTLKATVEATKNYKGNFATCDFTVAKQQISAPSIQEKVYNGVNQTADVEISENSLYTVIKNDGGVNVGSYDVVLQLKDPDNYKWAGQEQESAELTVPFIIIKNPNSWIKGKEPSIAGWTYGESANAPTATAAFGTDTLIVEYRSENDEDTNYSQIVPTNAGNYKVRFTVPGTENYDGLTTEKDLTIEPKTISIVWGETNFTYNGKEQIPSAKATGLLNEDKYKCDLIVDGAKTQANAATDESVYTATVTGVTNPNYCLPEQGRSTTFTIAPAVVDLNWSNTDVVYNGSKRLPEVNASTIGNDSCIVDFSVYESNSEAESSVDPINAGTYVAKAESVDNLNYVLPEEKTQAFVIRPKSLKDGEGITAVLTGDGITESDNVFSYVWDGGVKSPTIEIKDKSKLLKRSTDYLVSGTQSQKNLGDNYILRIKGKGNYTDTVYLKWSIVKNKLTFDTALTGWTYGEDANTPEIKNVSIDKLSTEPVYTYYKDLDCTQETTVSDGAKENGGIPKYAGTYWVKAYVEGTEQYEGHSAVTSFTISKKSITVIPDKGQKKIYGYTDPKLTYTVKDNELVTGDSLTIDLTRENGEDAGEYEIKGDNISDRNYEITVESEIKFTIVPKELTEDMLSLKQVNYSYTGNEIEVKDELLYHDETVEIEGTGIKESDVDIYGDISAVDYGAYKVTFAGKGNYTGEIEKVWCISPVLDKTFDYDGKPHSVEVKNAGNIDIEFKSESGEYTSELPEKVDAGVYEFEYRMTIDGAVYDGVAVLQINKVKPDLEIEINAEIPYGTEVAPSIKNYSGDGEVSYLYRKKEDDADSYTDEMPKALGEYVVKATIGESKNYEETECTAEFTIVQREIGLKWTGTDLTYNGKEQQPSAKATGLVGNDICEVTVTGAQKNANAGSESYTATAVKLSNPNYKLPSETTTQYTIGAKEIGIDWSNLEFTYDGTEKKPTATATDLIGDDTCGISVSGAAIDAGTHTAKAESTDNANYKLPKNVETKFVINKAETVISQKPESISDLTYTGEAQDLISAGQTKDGKFVYKVNGGEWSENIPSGLDAGTYEISYKVVGDKNHKDFAGSQFTVTIAKKAVVVSGITAKNKTYDGNTNAVLGYDSVKFDGVVGEDSLNVTAVGVFEDKNAGQKNVLISNLKLDGASAKNYVLAAEEQQTETIATIYAKEITAVITPNGGIYEGTITPATAVLNELVGEEKPEITLTYTGTANDGTKTDGNVPTHAGTYTVTASIADNNYSLKAEGASAEFVVAKADPAFSVSAIADKNYGEEAFKLETSNKGDGQKSYASSDVKVVTVDENGFVTIVGAGKATLTVSLAESANYNAGERTVDVTVKKVNHNLVVDKLAYEVTYGDKAFKIIASAGDKEKNIEFTSDDKDVASVSADGTVTVGNAGTAKITVSMDESQNYLAVAKEVTVTVVPKEVTVTPNDVSKVYGEKDKELSYTARDLVGKDTLSDIMLIRAKGENVGTYDITASVEKGANPNYNVKFNTGIFTITPKEIGLTWIDTNLTYNGQEQQPKAEATGLVENDTCEVTVTGAQKNTNAIAGSESYTATAVKLSNPNYKLPLEVTTQYTIGAKEIGIKWSSLEFTYDGTQKQPTAKATGLAEGDTCVITVSGSATEAGTHTAKAESVDNANYKLPKDTETKFGINKAETTISQAPEINSGLTYTGEVQNLISAGQTEDGKFVYKVNGGEWSETIPSGLDAGTYEVSYKVIGDKNHNDSEENKITVTIAKKTVVISGITAEDKTYDGNTNAVLKYDGVKFEGMLEKDSLSVTATGTFEDKNAGQKNVLISDLTLGGASVKNYVLAEEGQQGSTTATISVKEIGIEWNNLETIYDGTQKQPTAKATGLAEGDNCGITVSGSATEAGTHTAKAESVDNANYKLPKDAETKFVINKAETTVSKKPEIISNLTYTGKAQDLISAGQTSDGKFVYKVNGGEWSESIPSGLDAGTYEISYKVVGDANHNDSAEIQLTVTIAKKIDQSGLSGNAISKLDLPILLANGKGGNKQITLSWLKYTGASGYECYWSYCDGKKNFKKFATVKNGKLTATHKKLNNDRKYKYFVTAYKMVNGEKVYIARSNNLHVAMSASDKTNAVSVTVNKRHVTLKKNKTFTIKATTKLENPAKKQLAHTDLFRYYTTNSKVATVSAKGVIKAKGKGTCKIYVLANNGVFKSIKVKVK